MALYPYVQEKFAYCLERNYKTHTHRYHELYLHLYDKTSFWWSWRDRHNTIWQEYTEFINIITKCCLYWLLFEKQGNLEFYITTLTNFTAHSSLKSGRRSDGQESSHRLRNPNVRYCAHKRPSLGRALRTLVSHSIAISSLECFRLKFYIHFLIPSMIMPSVLILIT
jgi:hypothetical protein